MDGTCSPNVRHYKFIEIFDREFRMEETTRKTQHKWEVNIRMNLRETELEVVDWIHLAQERDWWRV
jgi:hypothetical protein